MPLGFDSSTSFPTDGSSHRSNEWHVALLPDRSIALEFTILTILTTRPPYTQNSSKIVSQRLLLCPHFPLSCEICVFEIDFQSLLFYHFKNALKHSNCFTCKVFFCLFLLHLFHSLVVSISKSHHDVSTLFIGVRDKTIIAYLAHILQFYHIKIRLKSR